MKNKLISMTIIKNEEKRFLQKWLDNVITWSDHCVIVDDASTDDTPKIIEEFMKKHNHPYIIRVLDKSIFKENELELRTILWEETRKIANEGDTCMVIDSDELMCPEINKMKQTLIDIDSVDNIGFKKIEMWDEENYRVDELWSNFFIRGFKFKDQPFGFRGKGMHLPCIPSYAFYGKVSWNSGIRVKHLAYCTKELREEKSKFALANCNTDDSINYPQLKSILADNPILKKYNDKIISPKINLIIPLFKHYNMTHIFNKLRGIMYEPSKLDLTFVTYQCHPQVYKQIEEFSKKSQSKVEIRIQNFYADTYITPVKTKLIEVLYEARKNEEYEYTFVLLPGAVMNAASIIEQLGTDRNFIFIINGNSINGIFISKEELNKYPPEMYTENEKFDFSKILNVYEGFIWRTGERVPSPLYK